MKRFNVLMTLGLLFAFMMLVACPSKPKIEPEISPADTSATTPEEPVEDAVEEEAPPEIIKESQFETVYFDFDKSSLRSDSKSGLDANYDLLMQFPDVMVKVEGHCDERGTVEYNLSLGEKRATSCKDYLVGLGIDASRISTISYGKEKPVDAGHSEAAWGKNRRCEFKIISQ